MSMASRMGMSSRTTKGIVTNSVASAMPAQPRVRGDETMRMSTSSGRCSCSCGCPAAAAVFPCCTAGQPQPPPRSCAELRRQRGRISSKQALYIQPLPLPLYSLSPPLLLCSLRPGAPTWEGKDDVEAHCSDGRRKPAVPPIQQHLQAAGQSPIEPECFPRSRNDHAAASPSPTGFKDAHVTFSRTAAAAQQHMACG